MHECPVGHDHADVVAPLVQKIEQVAGPQISAINRLARPALRSGSPGQVHLKGISKNDLHQPRTIHPLPIRSADAMAHSFPGLKMREQNFRNRGDNGRALRRRGCGRLDHDLGCAAGTEKKQARKSQQGQMHGRQAWLCRIIANTHILATPCGSSRLKPQAQGLRLSRRLGGAPRSRFRPGCDARASDAASSTCRTWTESRPSCARRAEIHAHSRPRRHGCGRDQ